MNSTQKINVLVIDDSATVRQAFTRILASVKWIEHVTVASDPIFAMEKMDREWPDVIILDIEMPRMDGITFLKKLMEEHPTPVIICSSITQEGSATAIQAMGLGAVEIISKPYIGVGSFLDESAERILTAIRAASISRPRIQQKAASTVQVKEKITGKLLKNLHASDSGYSTTDKIIAVGASTGGTIALETILTNLRPDIPGIIIVQHMPEKFTEAFAKRLNSICEIEVKEAENGDRVLAGRALIAPGNYHMTLARSGGHYHVEVKSGPVINHHRPSVDVLFRSVAKNAGKNALGVILTGMGDDGKAGMIEMKEAGSYNIAQDKESSVVWGMPGEAWNAGCADVLLPLDSIAAAMSSHWK